MSFFLRIFIVVILTLSSSLFGSIGKVSLLKGEAQAQRESQKITLQNGSTLEEKDIITTAKDAQIQLIFEDKTVITLGGESNFKIEEYLNDATNPKAKFKFNQGAFKTITGSIGKNAPQNFTMETKTATIGIRGTITAGNVPPPPPPNMPPFPEFIFCLGGTITVAPIGLPTFAVIVPTGSLTQMTTSNNPPSPPAPFTPADLQQLNRNLGGTPPPPPPGGTPPSGGNTPPTGNQDGGNDAPPPAPPPPPPPGPPAPQGFTPTAASNALQTNSQTLVQNLVVENIAQELNISVGTIIGQIQNQICPSGTTGTFPNCVAMSCPENTTGVYPNCIALVCPTGTTGTYPNCTALTCPTGTTGTYPNCVTQVCPAGTTGIYPNCTALTCPSGTIGTYPNCVAQTCPGGTTGTYPNCTTITIPPPPLNLALDGIATASYESDGTQYYNDLVFSTTIQNDRALGAIFFCGECSSLVSFSSSPIAVTSPTIFTINISDANITQIRSITSPDSNLYWGQWTSLEMENNTTLIPTTDNFWVAGTQITPQSAITDLATNLVRYTYDGKVLGVVIDPYDSRTPILPSDPINAVRFVFDFGSQTPINLSESYIKFGSWELSPSSGYISNGFAGDLNTGYFSGSFTGQFYGANAESIGGAFWASDEMLGTATGVFVGSNVPSVFEYPTTLSAALDLNTSTPLSLSMKGYATISTKPNAGVALSTGGGAALDMNWSNPSVPSVSGAINGITITQSTDTNLTYNSASKVIAIKNFDGTNRSYLLSETELPYGDLSFDYLSWGYWTAEGQATNVLLPLKHYWVAGLGSNIDAAKAYLAPLKANSTTKTLLRYEGSIYGHNISNDQLIYDFSAGWVKLNFELGNGTDALLRSSSLYVETDGIVGNGEQGYMLYSDPISPANVINTATGSFSINLTGDNNNVYHTGSLSGYFYGDGAKELGGTFYVNDYNHNVNLEGVFLSKKTLDANVSIGIYNSYNSLGNAALLAEDSNTSMLPTTLSGLATAWYLDGNTTNHSIGYGVNVTLDANTSSTARSATLRIANDSDVSVVHISSMQEASAYDDDPYSQLTIKSSNEFIVAPNDIISFYTDDSYPNDYVSWGYWGTKYADFEKAIASKNYWVAGKDAELAATHIAGLIGTGVTPITSYEYTGHSIGLVLNETTQAISNINTTTWAFYNETKLGFDFGAGSGSLKSGSYIKFKTDDLQIWEIVPTGTIPIDGTKFSISNTDPVKIGGSTVPSSSTVKGQFFGTQAQGIGGTFKASATPVSDTFSAIGVFKATRPSI